MDATEHLLDQLREVEEILARALRCDSDAVTLSLEAARRLEFIRNALAEIKEELKLEAPRT